MPYLEEIKQKLLNMRRITPEGCWLWTGSTDKNGYGQTKFRLKNWRVNRLSLLIFKPDEFKTELMALHISECHNPTCFNPDHLYAGDNSQNVKDSVKDGTHNKAKVTHCVKGHEFTDENTYISPSTGARSCKICRSFRNAVSNPSRLRYKGH